MSDKLEALSQPVAVMYADGYVMTREECGNAFAACCETQSPIYSQEYVTALLAALEEKDQRLKEFQDSAALNQHWIKTLEALADLNDKQRDHWMERANAAEQRLQQPIKLRSRVFEMMNVGGGHSIQVVSVKTVKEIIRAAGFKVEGE